MVVYKIVYTRQAAKDINNLKAAGLGEKAKELLEIIRVDPYKTPPRYEALVGNLSGLFSRRINIQHRLVYQVYNDPFEEDGQQFDGTIKIVRMWTHYDKVT